MSKEKLIIGLTGGIGSGKTAASDYFETLGICVVDADVEARAVVAPGTETLEAISEHFGCEVLNSDGSLNRPWLREKVFKDHEERQWLESVTHPAIRQRIMDKLATAQSPYSILVSPLLFESGQAELTDRVLLIDVPESIQIQRTTQRDDNSEDQVKAILNAQLPRDERRQKADDIILNDSDLSALQAACLKYHQHYMAIATTPNQSEV